MKVLNKFHAVLWVLLFVLMPACSDDDTVSVEEDVELTPEELAEMAAADRFAAANSVIRALAALDELPGHWESATFDPQLGTPLDAANSDVRNMVAQSAGEAETFFLSIVTNDGLNGNTWSQEGLGSLTFRALNEANCYAVIDVNLEQMPGLKQIRFVPQEVMGDNSFNGEPYYNVGDIVLDNNQTYWFCVRPSGGPSKKDYAYFVTFEPKTIEVKSYDQQIYGMYGTEVSKKKPEKQVSGKWHYATNLVEKRIAIAAAHTFSMFWDVSRGKGNYGFQTVGESNFQHNYLDVRKWINFMEDSERCCFVIPYGSYVSNKYKKLRQEKKLQPVLLFSHKVINKNKYEQTVETVMNISDGSEKDQPLLVSLTTDFDPQSYNDYCKKNHNWGGDYGHPNKPYSITDYMSIWEPMKDVTLPVNTYLRGTENLKVMVMTQMKVKDHGKKSKDLADIVKFSDFGNLGLPKTAPQYWESLKNVTRYLLDEKNDFTEVKDLYD